MELKEYLTLFKKYRATFFVVFFAVIFVPFALAFSRGEWYATTLSLHIARSVEAQEKTSEYSYDDFYRLQADERFADTVVRYLGSPRITSDILAAAEVSSNAPEKFFRAKRLSSQFIEVRYDTKNLVAAKKIATALDTVINEKTKELNGGEGAGWFRVLVDDPITKKSPTIPTKWAALTVLLAIFFAFWSVLVRYYISR